MRWYNKLQPKFILGKYTKFKENFLLKSPYEKWLLIRNSSTFLLQFIGCNVMDPNFKRNIVTVVPALLALGYAISMFYTLFYYRDQPMRALQCLPSIGIIVPVCYFSMKSFHLNKLKIV